MIALFLLLVIAAIVLGIFGVVVKGLLYLLIIGIVVFLGALLLAALRMRADPAGARPGDSPPGRPGPADQPTVSVGHRRLRRANGYPPPGDGKRILGWPVPSTSNTSGIAIRSLSPGGSPGRSVLRTFPI